MVVTVALAIEIKSQTLNLSGYPGSHYEAEDGLELLILLFPPPEC